MADRPLQSLRRFLSELRRRNVYRVGVTYSIVAFVVWQAASLLFPALGFPPWTADFVIVFTLLGFPIALVVAWAFEMTPEGVRRTEDAEPNRDDIDEGASETATGYRALVGLGLLAATIAGVWYLTGGGGTTISDRSVAVLPFETLGDANSSTFTEGLHNDLLTRLQRISELTVIARPSVMRYEDSDKPLQQVAEELDARWIVTAAVQTAGDEVQVNPRLIDPRTGTERWADSYRRELSADQVFALQEDITESIAGSLETELATGERERVGDIPTDDLDAYRLYAQGRRHFARRSLVCQSCVGEAATLFRRAVEQDSTFALAWAGLADVAGVFATEGVYTTWPDTVARPVVSQEFAARRAVELDPDLAEARAAMGHVYLQQMNAPAALRELQRALTLKPSYWEAHHWLGELYLKTSRAEEALEHLQLAVELNPQHAWARHFLYDAYLVVGHPERSLREARLQRRRGLEQSGAVGGEVRALIVLDRLAEARRLSEEKVAELSPETVWGGWFRSYLVQILAEQGDTASARKHLNDLRAAEAPPEMIARGYRGLGRPEEALDAYQRLDRDGWGRVGAAVEFRYGTRHGLTPVADDARYRRLLSEANRAWGLNPDGSLPDSVDV